MKKTNKTKYAILGMLLEKPRSGYSILNMMKQSTDHFWQESDASIYPMLKTLEAEEKVTSQSEFVGKRERKIFEITASGKEEFLAWMALPPEKENRRSEGLLKFFWGASVPKQEIIKQLGLHQQKVQETKKVFKSIEDNILSQISDKYPHKLFWGMALRYGIINADAELKWLEECFKVLEKK